MDVLKRVVIKEEFVQLTGDFKKAVILNQLIYWSQRISDFDNFIKEENRRINNNDIGDKPTLLQYGWIYKKAQDLSEETMLGLSKQTIGRILDELCKNGWIEKRRNPRYKWDKTYQYRVNLIKIAVDLKEIGYVLQDYKLDINNLIRNSNLELQGIEMELCNNKNGTAIPETITENTKQRIKEYRVDKHIHYIPFKEFQELLFKKESSVNTDAIMSMQYFIKWRNNFYKEKKYSYDTWFGLYEHWLDTEVNDRNIQVTYEESVLMINKFFNTAFEGNEYGECDYSPAFYCSDKVKELRFYESGLL